jgi:hypothetical protein
MTIRLRTITVDCADWVPLVAFWSQVTPYREDPANPNLPGDPMGYLVDPEGGPALLFIPVPEGKCCEHVTRSTPVSGTAPPRRCPAKFAD